MERSEAVVDEANEPAHVRQSSSAASIAIVLPLGVETLEAAIRLCGCRSKSTWAQWEDASEPPIVSHTELHGRARSDRKSSLVRPDRRSVDPLHR